MTSKHLTRMESRDLFNFLEPLKTQIESGALTLGQLTDLANQRNYGRTITRSIVTKYLSELGIISPKGMAHRRSPQRLRELANRVEVLTGRLDATNESLARMTARVGDLEERLTRLGAWVAEIESSVTAPSV